MLQDLARNRHSGEAFGVRTTWGWVQEATLSYARGSPTSPSTGTIDDRWQGRRPLESVISHARHLVLAQRGAPVGLRVDMRPHPGAEGDGNSLGNSDASAPSRGVIAPVAAPGPSAEPKARRRRVDQPLAIRPDRRRLAVRRAERAISHVDRLEAQLAAPASFHGL